MKRFAYLFLLLCLFLFGFSSCTAKVQSNVKEYKDNSGWSIKYPTAWNRVEKGFIQEESTGKTIEFQTMELSEKELQDWIAAEIKRKLSAAEGANTLSKPLEVEHRGKLTIYAYTISSKMESSEHVLKTTVLFDGRKAVEFRGSLPQLTEEEYNLIVKSFDMQ